MAEDARDLAGRLDRGIEAFNNERFFESHDLLEDLWMDVRGEERRFFQGLIQMAIGCYHLSTDNPTGAAHLLERGLAKLDAWRPSHRGIDVEALMADGGALLEQLRGAGAPDGFVAIRRLSG